MTPDECRVAREVADYLASQVHLTGSRLGTVMYAPHPTRVDWVRVRVQHVRSRPIDGDEPPALFLIEERTYDVKIVVQSITSSEWPG